VLNGTTNFILCRMHEQGQSFDEALNEAQQRGYAETDPSADVDGVDAAAKVTILSNAVLGRSVSLGDIDCAGIRGMTVDRLVDAAARGKRIKLVGECGENLRVAPMEVDAGGLLDVSETRNALSLRLRYGGEVTLTGRGAGGDETATAVMRDLVDIWHIVGSRS
jgi:homoserine dehydrogenase